MGQAQDTASHACHACHACRACHACHACHACSPYPPHPQATTRAREAGLLNVTFHIGEASDLLSDPPHIDLLVALHACGGLSDVALQASLPVC